MFWHSYWKAQKVIKRIRRRNSHQFLESLLFFLIFSFEFIQVRLQLSALQDQRLIHAEDRKQAAGMWRRFNPIVQVLCLYSLTRSKSRCFCSISSRRWLSCLWCTSLWFCICSSRVFWKEKTHQLPSGTLFSNTRMWLLHSLQSSHVNIYNPADPIFGFCMK